VRGKLLRGAALVAITAIAGCGSSSQTAGGARSFALSGKPMIACLLPGGVDAWCGDLPVAEDPSDPNGRYISVRVAVVPAVQSPANADPVFFITGGPGGSTISQWSQASAVFPELHQSHDIVLVDQRGTGGSHELSVPPIHPGETYQDYARRVLSGLDGDPRYYTTAVAMDDLDAVRQALGYGVIDLFGNSYGATAVQYYLRQHGDHVRAAVLDGGTLLDVPIMELVAANSQRALDAVINRCLADAGCRTAFPRVRSELSSVLSRLDRAPVTTSARDSAGRPVVVTRVYFASVIHSRLITAEGAASVPFLIHRAAAGHLEDIAIIDPGQAVPTLLMSLEIRCYEAWARFDPQRVRATGAGSYFLSAQLSAAEGQASACPLLPKGWTPAGDDQPARTAVPVLLLNGEADPQDPPSNVADAPLEMPNSLTVVVPGQGHTVAHLGCLPSIVAHFVATATPDRAAAEACAATVPVPPFQLN
jgi:pimeloyl-ACP methyl ester carboxylesterase